MFSTDLLPRRTPIQGPKLGPPIDPTPKHRLQMLVASLPTLVSIVSGRLLELLQELLVLGVDLVDLVQVAPDLESRVRGRNHHQHQGGNDHKNHISSKVHIN